MLSRASIKLQTAGVLRQCKLVSSRSAPRSSRKLRVVAFKEGERMSSTSAAPAGAVVNSAVPGEGRLPGTRPNPWGQQDLTPKYPALRKDLATEVVVIGAGFTGLATAYRLAKEGVKVVVLESRARAAGQTGRSPGHAQQWNDDFYQNLERKFGLKSTTLVAQSHEAAVDWLEEVVKREGIDCDFERVPGYLFPHDDKRDTYKAFMKELESCQRLGVSGVEKVDLGGDAAQGGVREALRFPANAQFNPVKLLDGLAEAVKRAGGEIYEGTRAKASPHNGRVHTMDGHTVVASRGVVIATHSPTNRNLAIFGKVNGQRTYMISMEIPKGSVPKAQWWDTAEPYHYVHVASGSNSDLLIIGGADHPSGMLNPPHDPYSSLEQWGRQRWPMAGRVAHKWSALSIEPIDQVGMFGKNPADPSNPPNWVLVGDSGQGAIGAAVGSSIVADGILGRSNPWSGVYSPARVITAVKSVREVAAEVVGYVRGFAPFLPLSLRDLVGVVAPGVIEARVRPGEGTVVQEGLRKVALYRDPEGQIHRKSAICTHLGCIVEWNDNDKSFDCPCHGSFYNANGVCCSGPAVADLEDLGGSKK